MMSNPYLAMGIDPSVMDHVSFHGSNKNFPRNLPNDWVPPPASSTTINFDGLDLNDEVFFHNNFASNLNLADYNSVPSSASFIPNFSTDQDASLLSSSLGTINYGALQSNITTPDLPFASPLKFDANTHYSHRRRFSLAVEQLNKMTLQHRILSLSLPSPESLPQESSSVAGQDLEKRTINPRQLFGVDPPSSSAASQNSRYYLPLLVSLPSLATVFKDNEVSDLTHQNLQQSQFSENDLSNGLLDGSKDKPAEISPNKNGGNAEGVDVMQSYAAGGSASENKNNNLLFTSSSLGLGDEYGSSIMYWLNDTSNILGGDLGQMKSPSVAKRPGWKRHNLIQVLPPKGDLSPPKYLNELIQKKKRRKSLAANIAEKEVPKASTIDLNNNDGRNSFSENFSNAAFESSAFEGDYGNKNQTTSFGSNDLTLMNSSFGSMLSIQKYENDLGQDFPVDSSKLEDQHESVSKKPDSVGSHQQHALELSHDQSQINYGQINMSNDHSPLLQTRPQPDMTKMSISRGSGVANMGNAGNEADDEPKPFPCPECDKQFKRLEHLKRHIRSVHLNIRPFHCKYCDKKFSRSDNLAQHLKTHFKVDANGATTVIYGNPNPHPRGGRKRGNSLMNEQPVPELAGYE